MTQDEIIEMARQAGFDEHHAKFDTRIETFAKLVAEAERERIKQDNAPEIEKINAYIDHAMREVQRLGQEIEQEPVAWPCLIDSADFSENTITLVMQCEDYKVSAGTHWLSTTPPKETT